MPIPALVASSPEEVGIDSKSLQKVFARAAEVSSARCAHAVQMHAPGAAGGLA